MNILGPDLASKELSWIHCHVRILGTSRKGQRIATNQVQLKTKRQGRVKSKEIQQGRAMRKDVKTRKSNY